LHGELTILFGVGGVEACTDDIQPFIKLQRAVMVLVVCLPFCVGDQTGGLCLVQGQVIVLVQCLELFRRGVEYLGKLKGLVAVVIKPFQASAPVIAKAGKAMRQATATESINAPERFIVIPLWTKTCLAVA
jgi:hypothetical protein